MQVLRHQCLWYTWLQSHKSRDVHPKEKASDEQGNSSESKTGLEGSTAPARSAVYYGAAAVPLCLSVCPQSCSTHSTGLSCDPGAVTILSWAGQPCVPCVHHHAFHQDLPMAFFFFFAQNNKRKSPSSQ